jgi:hypothetical protein
MMEDNAILWTVALTTESNSPKKEVLLGGKQ